MSTASSTGRPGVECCSACGRPAARAKALLEARTASTGLLICDHCVRECEHAIADAPTRIPGGAHTCAYCTKMEEHVAFIVGVGSKKVCDECIDAFRAALDLD